MRWEKIADETTDPNAKHHETYRAAVPGGWLVAVWTWDKKPPPADIWGGGLTFVPDPSHAWVVDPASPISKPQP